MARRGGRQRIPRPSGARPGAPAPWASLAEERRHLSLADVRARLAVLPPPRQAEPDVPDARDAAVLVPLFEEGGETRVILTKRPDTMPAHSGEIAFPGGVVEADRDDGPLAAALRESEEEIGLAPTAVEVVGELDGLATVASGFSITPFVGLLRDRPVLRPDPREVAAVFDVALAELLADGVFREERWDVWEPDRPVHFYELEGETVWGATARVLTALLDHLTRTP